VEDDWHYALPQNSLMAMRPATGLETFICKAQTIKLCIVFDFKTLENLKNIVRIVV
jgi:hypothetical protein